MSDYPMLISNKLHSFRNFSKTKIQHPEGEVKQSEKRYEPFLKKVHIPLFYFRLPFQAD